MNAIRVDNFEVIENCDHLGALLAYQADKQLTDDQLDEMILADRIEYGRVNPLTKEFISCYARKEMYTSIEAVRNNT